MANLLIVDDDLENLLPLALALEGDGHRVSMTDDSRRAAEIVHRDAIECVITDYQMPYVDGVQLCCALRSHPSLAGIPRFLLSAAVEPDDCPHCWTRFFRKPIVVNELLEAVSALLAVRLAAPTRATQHGPICRQAILRCELTAASHWTAINAACWP